MSDVTIPEDVMRTAVQFACCSADGCIRHDDECGEQMVCLEARQIARAILAEREAMRERCAKVADREAEERQAVATLLDGKARTVAIGQASVASGIAQAIRSSHE